MVLRRDDGRCDFFKIDWYCPAATTPSLGTTGAFSDITELTAETQVTEIQLHTYNCGRLQHSRPQRGSPAKSCT